MREAGLGRQRCKRVGLGKQGLPPGAWRLLALKVNLSSQKPRERLERPPREPLRLLSCQLFSSPSTAELAQSQRRPAGGREWLIHILSLSSSLVAAPATGREKNHTNPVVIRHVDSGK